MTTQLTTPTELPNARPIRRGPRVLIVLAIASTIVAAALVAGWLYLRSAGRDTTGLEGTWTLGNSRHVYEFRRNGELACWTTRSREWWSRLGWVATWKRDGQKITIVTDRNWDFVGERDGDTIRGKMLMKNPAGVVEQELPDMEWHRQ